MDRRPIVGGNWKMNTTRMTGTDLARQVREASSSLPGVDVVVFPPFPYLLTIGEALRGSGVELGAQDVFDRPEGAFTGEVSVGMLKDCGVSTVLVGHSERRHVIGEGDGVVNAKLRAALEGGLRVVLCVGEKLDQREAGETDSINERQVRAGLGGVSREDMDRIVIAYEPVWAIGTGKTASPQDAQNAHVHIRRVVGQMFDLETAEAVRIQYGGSVTGANARELFGQADVDGGLVGGASLKPTDFAQILAGASA